MPVAISDILHVLAHELRTPVGVAHGYVRLLLEDRLAGEADRRRALEQTQKALGRLRDLGHESTALAEWYEQNGSAPQSTAAQSVMEQVAAASYEFPVRVDSAGVNEKAILRTSDATSLVGALASVIRATARELRGQSCTVSATIDHGCLQVLVGPASLLPVLSAGPNATGAGPLVLKRGGLGLALVHAAVVLDAHGADRWTMNDSRQTAGIRLPLEERPLE